MLKNFPAAEKFCLCQEIKQANYRLIRDTVMFTNIRTAKRMEYLQEADAEKTLLLTLFAVARNQKYITKGKALELQADLAEIGRIIGGLQQAYYGYLCLASNRANRGYNSARNWNYNSSSNRNVNLGFRPAL